MLNRKTKVMSNCQVQITSLFSIMHYLKAFTQFFSVSELNTSPQCISALMMQIHSIHI